MKSGISLRFWFTFSWWVLIVNIFSCACWSFVYIIWRLIYSDSLFIFKLGYLYITIELAEFFIYSEYKFLIRYLIWKFVLPFVCCRSTFLIILFKAQTKFEFWWYLFYPFFILLFVFLLSYLQNLPNSWSRFTPKFLLLIVV